MAPKQLKKNQFQFSHISRRFIAPILNWTKKYQFRLYLSSILVLAILLSLNLITPFIVDKLPLNSLEKNQIKAQNQPQNALAHLELAQELLQNKQLTAAQKELELGRDLISSQFEQTQLLLVEKQVYQADTLAKKVIKWEKISQTYPNYRDAHLQLAYYYYQLNRIDKAKENLAIALKLDPNFGPARELEKIIKQTEN